MKYGKIIAKIFAQRKNNNAQQVAVALVAGLAAGAIISILFAPESGSNTRKTITDRTKGLGGGLKNSYASLKNKIAGNNQPEKPIAEPEVPHFVHLAPKKRKSDLKDLIHDAHNGEQHTEQSIS